MRWSRSATPTSGPRGDFSEAQFEAWISQEHRKDLALLLGAQDGQERWSRLSIHYQKNTLQFADSRARVSDSRRGRLCLLLEADPGSQIWRTPTTDETFRTALSAKL